ncbi:MAG: restriction endonuclease subunit S [Gammaproteobacteria bacterium]|nr:restriction endonuclease subunit S [Gammaproteobacteria bacterium]
MSAQSLKSGWKMLKFGDFAQNVAVRVDPADAKTDVYVGLEHLDPSTIHLRHWGHPSDVTGQKLAFKKGDVIFGRRRAYQRKLAVAEFDGICSAHAMVVRAKPKMILPEFLPFFLQSDMFMDRAIEISVGSLSPTINWKTLRVQEFPLPPLDEQKRIAEILWAADEAVESQSKLILALKTAKSVSIKEFCLKGISHDSFQPSAFGEIPNSWSVQKLGEVCEFLDGKRIPIKKADRAKRQGEFPYYGASGIIDWIDDFIFDDELILIGEDGANIVDRSTPLAFKVSGKIWVNNHAHVLKPLDFMDIDFLVEYLESISYTPYTSGTAQPKINKSACESIPIPVPPLDEQKKISSIFVSYDAQLRNAEKVISDTKDLLMSVMSEALEGAAHV